ncbi:MAG: MotA/TolQ/ExbB proton channel family protein [Planctomycetota bacterium]|nr:MAG: MotA/TolQ/ExbB proton channel family protein [Planctomycetota bacterium]
MRVSNSESRTSLRRLRFVIVALGLSLVAVPLWSRAQEPADQDQPAAAPQPAETPVPVASKPPAQPTIWDLTVQGGIFMIPLFIDSIIVLAYAIERHFGLRGKKILPPKLLLAIQQLNSDDNGIDPKQAYQACQKHPSPLANVIRAAILKIGRPHSELEQAVQDAVGREADEMSDNLRPINVSVSVAPLIGLLGTVQGMIMAFMVTSTTTATGAAKSQELAQGIYTALVTTFGGLVIAIPAVLIASWLESRIDRLLRDMEDVFLEILPQFERFEGKLRIRAVEGGVQVKGTVAKPATAPAKPVAASKPPPAGVEPATPKGKGLWGVMGAKGETSGET